MLRRDFSKLFGGAIAALVMSPILPTTVQAKEVIPTSLYDNSTRLLATTWTPEMFQDLYAFTGVDAYTELTRILEDRLEKELGNARGTITTRVRIDPDSFQPKRSLYFINDGKNGKENLWGLDIFA